LCLSLRISDQLPAPIVNGGGKLLKMKGFPTFKGLWP